VHLPTLVTGRLVSGEMLLLTNWNGAIKERGCQIHPVQCRKVYERAATECEPCFLPASEAFRRLAVSRASGYFVGLGY